MAYYVLVGTRKERCRAKDPSRCRYHVGVDGKPLRHYPDTWSADRALERLKESLHNDPRGINPTGDDVIDLGAMEDDPFLPDSKDAIPVSVDEDKTPNDDEDPDDGVDGTLFHPDPMAEDTSDGDDDAETSNDAGPDSSTDEDPESPEDDVGLEDESLVLKIRKTRIQKMRERQWSEDDPITPGVIQSLNRARAESSVIRASSQSATNMVIAVMGELKRNGMMKMELMWGYEDSPALWPELWSTRENDPYRELTLKDYAATDRIDVKLKRRWYLDPTAAEESWSHDVMDGETGAFDTEELHYEAGLYDAVRSGFLKWEDLRGLGATSCVMTAVESIGVRSDGSPFLKTVNVWCGRKPKTSLFVTGDENVMGDKAFKDLKNMMITFEKMVAGMAQAMVTLTVIGSKSDLAA